MTVKTAVALILILETLGCAATTGKDCTPPAPPGDKAAELIVYRPSAFVARLYDVPISIDDCIVGMLQNGAFIRYKVAAGTLKVRAEKRALAIGGDAEISAAVPPGKTIYIKLSFLGPMSAGFAVADRISAEKEMPALRGLAQ